MSGENFSASLQNPPVPSPPVMDNLRLAFGGDGAVPYKPTAAPAPAAVNGEMGGAVAAEGLNMNVVGDPVRKKRGRPRKYGPEGSIALALNSGSAGHAALSPAGGGFGSPPPPPSHGGSPTFAAPQSGDSGSASLTKRRGRPPGSSNKKRRVGAPGSGGMGFTPHVITVKAGEDVSSKIMSFSQNGPRAVCVLSANGAISNVTLRQPATSGGTVTYEGRFEILSLSGSFLLSDNGGHRSRTGGLSVSLSGPDGRVLGGGVAGLLTAASPVQVVVGSFMAESRTEMKSPNQVESFLVPGKFAPGGVSVGPSSPPSHGTLSESSGGPGSPLNQSTGVCNNSNSQGMSSMPWR
ncbi:AT-hook motif nuclear-localized protein 10-like [Rhodamnia argentea]|uniref:AT-hook motif nuclear-localized protein n=1 Tax=Rhodamnia argentea TaxID=178133 RepID=A0A8B8NWY3_9MYRT|nr:AT-hook motif nuclear-localized protein 10-like [Rhodamnia argentea]XP_030527045.1 AT-hook motif nuclear-localized protein 10-like [Rhodamnia argentea]